MNFIKKIFGLSKQPSDVITESIKNERMAECPSCKGQLKKIPGRKTKCPHCGQFMYVRTRPKDNVRVVVTKEQADEIDEEWAIASGTHNDFLAKKEEIENERKVLRKRFGKEPSESDVKWGVLNKQLITHAQDSDWGLYRNTRFEMAEILRKEIKLKNALQTYLEVCYLDLNGPNNRGGMNDPELLKEFPPFDPKNSAFLAPGVVDRVKRIIEKLKLGRDEVKQMFVEHNSRIEKSLKLPLSPETCWTSIDKEL
ncbi:MAG TPA: hypothetical protein ENH13_03090 [Euryarchaeota archaeon]|nr:hypothetical protein [Euryarchaeota archaeon]